MADFTEIIQEINTNLPDNTTQSITAAKLRTTMIDLTETIENQQDAFEEDIQGQFNTLEGQIDDAVLDFQSVIVDNLNSTDSAKALSAKQGNILKETIYGTNDDTLGTSLSYGSLSSFGFQNGSSSSSNCFITSGNIRSNYWTESNFINLEIGKYRYLRIEAKSGRNAYITFLKKNRPTAQKTYQELVDEGYLSKVHNSYSNVLITIDAGTKKDIEIPNDAKAFMVVARTSGDGSSASTTVRQPESITPYGLIQPDNIYYNVTIPDGYIDSKMIANGEVNTNEIADGAVTGDKLESDLVQKEMTGETNEYFSFNLIDFNNISSGYINTSGTVTSSSAYYATQFIKLDGKKIYWGIGFTRYGTTTNGAAVYNANKELIRVFVPSSSGSYDPATSGDEGAEYIRLTYTGNYTLRYVVYAKSDGSNPMDDQSSITTSMIDDYYRDQVINNGSINISFPKENVPEAIPAISMCGQNGISKTYESITGGNYVYVTNTEYPSYLKCNHTISFKGYIANALSGSDTIKFGLNRNNSTGKILEITPTQAIIKRYDSDYVTNKAYTHNLTIQDFVMCEVSFNWYGGKMRIVSSGGSFVQEWQNSDYSFTGNAQVNYGRVFLQPSMDMTNIKLTQSSDRFMKPVWVIGDSYTSMASARWTWQMVNTFGVDGFLLDGYAGAPSENMVPELKQLLKYGTPKYLYWCLGMNDGAVIWKYCSTEVEMLCRERGITLIYQTIPWPTSSSGATAKSVIDKYIKESGYRYVDAYSAVCKDDNGTWYDGMLDDGTHPTVLGAKAIAGQVLVDFPEIANYK